MSELLGYRNTTFAANEKGNIQASYQIICEDPMILADFMDWFLEDGYYDSNQQFVLRNTAYIPGHDDYVEGLPIIFKDLDKGRVVGIEWKEDTRYNKSTEKLERIEGFRTVKTAEQEALEFREEAIGKELARLQFAEMKKSSPTAARNATRRGVADAGPREKNLVVDGAESDGKDAELM
jgi:hypothetical protein